MSQPITESDPPSGRLARLGRWFAGSSVAASLWGWILVGAIAFRLSANFVLNHFYADGAGVDAWLLAAVIWRNDAALTMPAAAVFPLHSILGSHLTWLLIVPALLSHAIPIGMIAWYAVMIGAQYALLALAMFRTALRDYRLDTRGGILIAAALGLGFAFGGVPMAALQLPHYELLLVGFGVLFFGALARGLRRAAWVWFVLAMLVREDAGFHFFGILVIVQLLAPRREAWIFVIAALAWSLAEFGLIRIVFPGDANFARVYAGDPFYAHLTWGLVSDRLATIWSTRTYLWLPPLVALAWAVVQREPLVLAGFVAALPWALLHMTAVSGGAGTLDLYYAFPFLMAIGWACIAPVWRARGPVVEAPRRTALIGQAALVGAALVGWMGDRFVVYPVAMNLGVERRALNEDLIEGFATRFAAGLPSLGAVRADYGALGLAPQLLRPANWLNAQSLQVADTVIWFDPGQQDSLAWATWLSSHLNFHYQVVGSSIMIATNRRLDQSPLFAPAVAPTNAVWRRMRPTAIADRTADGFYVPRSRPAGLIAEGPHDWWRYGLYFAHGVALPAGQYVARFELQIANASDPAAELVRLEAGFAFGPTVANAVVRADRLSPETLSGRQPMLVSLPFAIDQANAARYLQLRAIHLGNADVTLRGIGLVRTD
jgi:hypothetical protein